MLRSRAAIGEIRSSWKVWEGWAGGGDVSGSSAAVGEESESQSRLRSARAEKSGSRVVTSLILAVQKCSVYAEQTSSYAEHWNCVCVYTRVM